MVWRASSICRMRVLTRLCCGDNVTSARSPATYKAFRVMGAVLGLRQGYGEHVEDRSSVHVQRSASAKAKGPVAPVISSASRLLAESKFRSFCAEVQ